MRVPFTAVFVPLVVALGGPAAAQTSECGGRVRSERLEVSRSSARCPWPFRADRIVVRCRGVGLDAAVFVEAAGRTYGLNGNARDAATRYGVAVDDPAALFRPDAPTEAPWIRAGLRLCPGTEQLIR